MIVIPVHHTHISSVGAWCIQTKQGDTACSLSARRDLVVANRQMSEDSMRAEMVSGKRSIETFRRDLDHFKRQLLDIRRIRPQQ